MKGHCPKCGRVINDTEYSQGEGMCYLCYKAENEYYGRGLPLAKNWNKEVNTNG